MPYVPPARVMMIAIFLLYLLLISFFSQTIARDTITPTQPLADNETLISGDGTFAMGFFSPGSSNNRYVGLWYNKHKERTVVWVANHKNPVINSSSTGGVLLSISNKGNLVITNQINSSTVINVWSSGMTTNVSNPVAQLLNTGNLVVRDGADEGIIGTYAWQGFDYPTDTLIEGMKLGVDLVTGLNRTLTAWTSDSDPSPSPYYVMMEVRGDSEVVLCEGSKKVWRTGPWNGLGFSGVPDKFTNTGVNFSFINNEQEITFSFNIITNSSYLSKLTVNQSGALQRSLWVEDSGTWNLIWHAPMDQCDPMGSCGPFAVCNPINLPICDCIQGFTPKSPEKWLYGRDSTDGCVRKTNLDCKNGTDEFRVIPYTKLADSSNASVDKNLSLVDCKTKCLSNCSCTGYAPTDVRDGGSGCIIWTSELMDLRVFANNAYGQDLYVRLNAIDIDQSSTASGKSSKWVIVFVIILVSMVLILAYIGYLIWKRRKRRQSRAMQESNNSFHDQLSQKNDLELPLLDFGTILSVTENFSAANKLGEGGFGPVYKGRLGDGQEIAVKRLAKSSMQGKVEFKNEVVLIAKLQHWNLVRLLGCCIEGEERLLVYEYMPNKSLDFFLFGRPKDEGLDWQTRFKIIMGIARGLLYLHQDSRLRVIHRDLKASNILLDEEMNPKISDFGTARIFGRDEVEGITRKVIGTYGYMSPEYAIYGNFSQKSDVFSFGVLVLEIITGKKNRGVYLDEAHTNLLDHVWNLWKEGNSLQMVDESMGCSYPMNEVMSCIKVGLLCVQNHPEDRPLMPSVLFMLSSDSALLPYPKEPGFAMRSVQNQMEFVSSKPNSSSTNDISMTLFEGR